MSRLAILEILVLLLGAGCGATPIGLKIAGDGGPAFDAGIPRDGGDDGGVADGGTANDGGGISDGGVILDGGATLDGGAETDGGAVVDGGGAVDGGSAVDGGGAADGGCVSDPGCPSPGPRCDPNGSNQIGSCVDVGGGCLKFQNPVTCPSTLQTCPVGATACACPAAGVTVGTGCSTPGSTICSENIRLVCAHVGACNIWQQSADCAATGLLCETRNGSGVCVCPANPGTLFYADSVHGSAAGAAPFATGLEDPPQCRYQRLTDALHAANALAQAGTSALVIATGQSGTTPMRFGNETFPLEVRALVNLTTNDSPLNPSHYVIDFKVPTVTAAVRLRGGAQTSGFTIANARPTSTIPQVSADAVVIDQACGGETIGIDFLTLDGAPPQGSTAAPLVNGIRIASSCQVEVTNTTVLNMGEAGLRLESPVDPSTTPLLTSVLDSNLASNNRGILAVSGALHLETTTIASNRNEGIQVSPSTSGVTLTLVGGTVQANAKEGIKALATTAQAKVDLSLDGVNVRANGGAGLQLGGGAATGRALGQSRFEENGTNSQRRAGVVISDGASFSSEPGLIIAHNSGHGLVVSGGKAELSGISIDRNQQHGLYLVAGGLSFVNGSKVTGNGLLDPPGAGLRIEGGALTLDGDLADVEIAGNGLGPTGASAGPGIDFDPQGSPASLSANRVLIQGNGGAGLRLRVTSAGAGDAATKVSVLDTAISNNKTYGGEITNALPGGMGIPISIQACKFDGNATANLQVSSSNPLDNTGTRSLQVLGSYFGGGGTGVVVIPLGASASTKAAVSFTENTVTGAGNTGVSVNGTSGSSIDFSRNEIYGNNQSSGLAFLGGVVLTGAQPATWSFTGNYVRRNKGQQVVVAGDVVSTASWNLSGPSDCSAPNLFCGYDWTAGRYGLSVGGANVDARYNSWTNHPPEANKDFFTLPGSSVTATPDCGSGIPICPQ
jgi:hypothetical protein